MAHVLKPSFNAGELSPLMGDRVDAEKHSFSCRTLTNFIPKIYGGAFRRPGTVYVGTVGDGASEVMLVPLNISADVRYVLEFGDEYLRIWNSDGTAFVDQVNSPYTNTLELTTPYTAAQLFDVKWTTINNIAVFAHPSHAPQVLTRFFDQDQQVIGFTWAEIDLDYPCFRDRSYGNAVNLTESGGVKTATFDSDAFTETEDIQDYVGAKIKITYKRETSQVSRDLTLTGATAGIVCLGGLTVTTFGSWNGNLYLEQRNENEEWQKLRHWRSNEDRNIAYTREVDSTRWCRLNYVRNDAGTGAPRGYMDAHDSETSVIIEILTVSDAQTCTFDFVDYTGEDEPDVTDVEETTNWSVVAWGDYCGYPRAVAFHEQRLWFGGTDLEPNTFWSSKISDFFNFRRGAFAADGLNITLAATEGSSIQSMLSHESLLIFTQTEEWALSTSEQTSITASNAFVRRQSRFGSANRQAILANNNLLFLQRGKKKLREFVYASRKLDSAEGVELSVLAEHLIRSGVEQMAFQQHPDPILWMVNGDGELISMTYESAQDVVGWSRHTTEGTFESVCVIYGDDGGSDEVWVIANRDGGRYVERIDPDAVTSLESDDYDNQIYVDSAVTYSGAATSTLTGLDHLDGETVDIVADNNLVSGKTVSSGSVTLDEDCTNAIVGLPYTSTIQPAKIELALEDGTSQGRRWNCKQITLSVWKTRGGDYADSTSSSWYTLGIRESSTEEVRVNNQGSHRESVDVAIRQTQPYPFNLLSLIIEADVV